jgi:hypothetical protein
MGGTYSVLELVSPGGLVGGTMNAMLNGTLKSQPFIARRVADPHTSSITWQIQIQSDPASNFTFQALNDAGEMLGRSNQTSPVSAQIPTLWRRGQAYPLPGLLPAASGFTLNTVTALNANGTLLASAWMDGASVTLLLTPDRDTDGDGLPDRFENQHSFHAFVKNNASTDSDADGLSDLDEFRNATDPRHDDSDRDGMQDGWEVSWGLLPLDPSDAPLDPDSDQVTNLRESQIGTTPTGIYKVETRFTDTSWIYPNFIAAADKGQIVCAGQGRSSGTTDEYGYSWAEYSQEYFALPAADAGPSGGSVPLPMWIDTQFNNSDWSEYSGWGDYPSYYADSANGRINGEMYRYGYAYDAVNSWWEETYFLMPDVANHPDESNWIPLAAIESNLRDPYLHDGTAPLAEYDSLYPYPDRVSPSGVRRLHRSWNNECLILDERGEFVGKLADPNGWERINDEGTAVRLETVQVPAANGLPAYDAPLLVLSTGETIPIPHEPGISPNYWLQSFSNDGNALLGASVKNHQLASTTQYHLFDTATGTLSRIRRPGLGYESITNLSLSNSRLLGSGPKPFQITPDGSCIRLEALLIKNSPDASAVPFGTLYLKPLTPNHIASNGRITLTTTNSQNRQVILQIVPHNDSDGDTMPDDWETSHGITDAAADADSDGLGNAAEFAMGTDALNQDSDGDGIPDGIDNQPLLNAHWFADRDDDGIADSIDAQPANPRGPPPSIGSETASGNPVSNLIIGETVRFVITVSNPGGPMPEASNLTFYLNGTAENVSFTAIDDTPPSTRRFLFTWIAKTTADYPNCIVQNLTLRFRDAQQATSWLNLARIDVAEWEGMIASLRSGTDTELPVLQVFSHFGGNKCVSSYEMTTYRSKAGWYRGPRDVSFVDDSSGSPLLTAQIPGTIRYPLFLISASSLGLPVLDGTISISDATTYTHSGYLIVNNCATDIQMELTPGGSATISSGRQGYLARPEPDQGGPFIAFRKMYYKELGNWKLFQEGVVGLASAIGSTRDITAGRFYSSTAREGFSRVWMDFLAPVGAQITPHAAGPLEHPGLPLPCEVHTGSTRPALLPISRASWHKIILKVGPDAEAVSNGIGLWLRKGRYNSLAPQTGFTLKIANAQGILSDLTIPPDGKINFAVGTPDYQQLLSPAGLTVFIKRDENATDAHVLSLELLKKHQWFSEESAPISYIDIVPCEIVPDWNRDGRINASDSGKATTATPWRYWVNKDDDSGETEGTDIPGDWSQGWGSWNENWQDEAVNGIRDLVDYFPLHLDLKAALESYPEGEYQYTIKHETQTHFSIDGFGVSMPSFGIVWCPEIDPAADPEGPQGAGSYLFNKDYARLVATRPSRKITSEGIAIPGAMLAAARKRQGIILVEGRQPTSNPLTVEIRDKKGKVICNIEFPVSVSGVEDMFRHKNLRSVTGGDGGMNDRNTCQNYPDALCNQDWLVFLHGYNVNGTQARGWHSEAFKRLFWSGSKAKFVGVSWYGDESQVGLPGRFVCPIYFDNIENALNTSGHLCAFVNGLEGGKKYLATHSLGGLAASYAIAQQGMQAEKAFLFDPALPTEALLPKHVIMNDPYIEPLGWRPYPDAIKSSDWYRLFPPLDARSTLTWRGLVHAAAPKLKIFFSEGEEVLAALPLTMAPDPGWAGDDPPGQFAFCIQAMLKGMKGREPDVAQDTIRWGSITSFMTHAFGGLSPASYYGGWGTTAGSQNPKYIDLLGRFRDPEWFQESLDAPGQDGVIFRLRLQDDPPFRVFGSGLFNFLRTEPDGCEGLFETSQGPQVAAVAWKHRRILAQMIPERTLPAGGAGGSGVAEVKSLQRKFSEATGGGRIEVFDMEENRNGWVQSRNTERWLHGDLREVAYTHVWKAWQEIVTDSGIDQKP